MSKSTKRYLIIGLLFCVGAVAFALIYYFKLIKNFNLTLAAVYIGYFVGIGLLFNGSYCKKRLHNTSAIFSSLFGVGFVCFAIVFLIIGLTNGQIQFW